MFDLNLIPIQPQRQDSATEQLEDLQRIANRLGMYDAADIILQMHGKLDTVKYGCYCDLDEGMTPDDCVIDSDQFTDCIYAKPGMRKEQCKHWKIIT